MALKTIALLLLWRILVDGKLLRSATSQHSDPALASVSSFLAGGQYILLTFAHGPHRTITPQILDILRNHSIHATFFVFGQKSAARPHLLKRMVEEGHEIGQQGYYTKPLKLASTLSSLVQSINATSALLHGITGQRVQFFRPPLDSDAMAVPVHKATGLRTILWSIDVSDKLGKFADQYASPEVVADLIVQKAAPGAVIQALDTHPLWTQVLPIVLSNLTAQGYEFLTVSQMMLFPDDAPH